VTVSDTHTFGPRFVVPEGDLLIHAGDHTFRGTADETKAALEWLESLPHKYKLFVAGNHDWFWDENAPTHFRSWALFKPYSTAEMLRRHGPSLTYLQDSGVEIEGLKFWGSPWSKEFGFNNKWAFNFPKLGDGSHETNTWNKIPADTNVLITHTPPVNILDSGYEDQGRLGDPYLMKRIGDLTALRLHVFGHIHSGAGRLDFQDESTGQLLTFVNAAICDEQYRPINPVQVIDL